MKKIITIIAVLLLITSCSSNDEDTFEGSQSDLTGTWKIVKVIVEGNQISLNTCDSQEKIIVDSSGNASWNYYLNEAEPCNVLINNFTFKAININFEIGGTSQNTSMFGKFQGSNKIEITRIYRNPDLTTIYTFTKT